MTMTLFLQFEIGDDAYVLEAARVTRVVPLVDIKRIPRAPVGVAGAFNYHGTAVPVVDLSEITLGRPAARLLSTRVILVPVRVGAGAVGDGHERLLGLMAEKVTQTLERNLADFGHAGVTTEAAGFLGPVTMAGTRLLQWIDVRRLLPAAVSEALFSQVGVTGGSAR
jgi:chemotaxis-related protein WspB